MSIFHKYILSRHLKLEIAIAIPAWNEWKNNTKQLCSWLVFLCEAGIANGISKFKLRKIIKFFTNEHQKIHYQIQLDFTWYEISWISYLHRT